ncbi:MAG: gliding motility-associated C-terminal domain-containing protein [Bacteroidales bacterium]|nr:gliding motility-associated C-terminal domain-containing protein [Bacteroidales bacterium]
MATHNRAGEIVISHVEGYTYMVLVTTYTYSLSMADRPELDVMWGDGDITTVKRYKDTIIHLPDNYNLNRYIAIHEYPGPGVYQILVQDPNRNAGVKNIPNSVNTIFSIKTTIFIDPQVGDNSTPFLLNYPIDKAAVGHVFIHNPGAFDPDGDSISYKLTICTKENGEPIPDYTLPPASDSIYIDEVTGDLIWDSPTEVGIYNVAMNIEEWRQGVKIGNVVRDMQIQVYDSDNEPPEIFGMQDLCVVAGDTARLRLWATDADNDSVFVIAQGGPFAFNINPAKYYHDTIWSDYDTIWTTDTTYRVNATFRYDYSTLHFVWPTHCIHVRGQPYTVIVRAEDDAMINLVNIKTFNVQVIGPPTNLVETQSNNNSITIFWEPNECANISGYNIYRKEDSSDFVPGFCQTGVPGNTGFILVGMTYGADTAFIDNNNGSGLLQGIEYCYRVVARYPDGAVSIASNELCNMVVPGKPAIIKTSVAVVDDEKGVVELAWLKPRDIDTSEAPGPYEIVIYRSDNLTAANAQQIHSFITPDLNDTTYIDSALNTVIYPYSYRIELYNNTPGNRFLIGNQEVSSTLFHNVENLDNEIVLHFEHNVPWVNTEYTVYRKNSQTGQFDSIGVTTEEHYSDTGLTNGVEYCYRTLSRGFRQIEDNKIYTENYSHINCGIPIDTFPSCPPQLIVTSNCDSMVNVLQWTNPNETCADDVIRYNVYYKPDLNSTYQVIYNAEGSESTRYVHYPEQTIAGCYVVTAIDSFNNESDPSNTVCVDICPIYELPNVFSPDGDGKYDLYRAMNKNDYVKKVNMRIFNRWGDLVYETDDPYINWKGTYLKTKKLVSPGVYYYICEVHEPRIGGIYVRNLTGFIYVFTDVPVLKTNE